MTDKYNTLAVAYASAPVNTVVLETLELHHQAFVDDKGVNRPFRFVSSNSSLVPVRCKLEPTAPVNPGETVTFDPAPIAISLPAQSDTGNSDLQITLADVTMAVEEQLDNAVSMPGKLRCFYRIYLLDVDTGTVSDVQNTPFEWSLQGCSCNDGTMTATATLVDIVNRPFPYHLYTPAFAPGLVR